MPCQRCVENECEDLCIRKTKARNPRCQRCVDAHESCTREYAYELVRTLAASRGEELADTRRNNPNKAKADAKRKGKAPESQTSGSAFGSPPSSLTEEDLE